MNTSPPTGTPAISVVMPVHNGAEFLGEAIESILGQSFRDFELLVIDDGSTDDSRRIAQSYRDPRLRVLPNERNLGLIRTLNRGIEQARAPLIARMDDDDVSLPGRFAAQVRAFERDSDLVICGTDFRGIDAEGRPKGRWSNVSLDPSIRWNLTYSCPFCHPSVLFSREAVLNVGKYSTETNDSGGEKYGKMEDLELWSRLMDQGRMCNIPEVLVHYRRHHGSITHATGFAEQERRSWIRRRVWEKEYGEEAPPIPPDILDARPRDFASVEAEVALLTRGLRSTFAKYPDRPEIRPEMLRYAIHQFVTTLRPQRDRSAVLRMMLDHARTVDPRMPGLLRRSLLVRQIRDRFKRFAAA